MPKAQSWAEEIFHNNKEIKEWLDSLTLDWDKIINEVVKFLRVERAAFLALRLLWQEGLPVELQPL